MSVMMAATIDARMEENADKMNILLKMKLFAVNDLKTICFSKTTYYD